MDDPTQQEEPEYAGEHELNNGYEKPTLEQLAKSRDEKAAEGRDNIAGRSPSSHVLSKSKCPNVHLTTANERGALFRTASAPFAGLGRRPLKAKGVTIRILDV